MPPSSITIAHELPGRVRFRLSRRVQDRAALEGKVAGHEGILSVECTPMTGSVLVLFDPEAVTREEIVVRLGVACSLDWGGGPVRVFSQRRATPLSDSAFYSGVLLALASTARLSGVGAEAVRLLDVLAGLGTAAAALGHGWQEVKREGTFDPEVFSVVYLLVAMVRAGGAALPAALFTWFTTFGRHLVEAPSAGVELRPVQHCREGEDDSLPTEVVVSPVAPAASGASMALTVLSSALRYTLTGGGAAGGDALLREIGELARTHGEVIEGLGELRRGIPVKVLV